MARDIARSVLPYPWEAGTLLGRLPGPRECYGDVFLARTHLLHSGSVCFLTLSLISGSCYLETGGSLAPSAFTAVIQPGSNCIRAFLTLTSTPLSAPFVPGGATMKGSHSSSPLMVSEVFGDSSQTFSQGPRLGSPTAFLASLLGRLLDLSDSLCPNRDPALLPLPLSC